MKVILHITVALILILFTSGVCNAGKFTGNIDAWPLSKYRVYFVSEPSKNAKQKDKDAPELSLYLAILAATMAGGSKAFDIDCFYEKKGENYYIINLTVRDSVSKKQETRKLGVIETKSKNMVVTDCWIGDRHIPAKYATGNDFLGAYYLGIQLEREARKNR